MSEFLNYLSSLHLEYSPDWKFIKIIFSLKNKFYTIKGTLQLTSVFYFYN